MVNGLPAVLPALADSLASKLDNLVLQTDCLLAFKGKIRHSETNIELVLL